MQRVSQGLLPAVKAVDVSVIAEAARAAIDAVGGGATMARICGVTRFAVQQWKDKGIPPRHVGKVAHAARMSPASIRPDLFPVEGEGV